MILIRQDREIYGPFEKEQVEDMLIEGRVTLDDAAKAAEGGDWKELVKVLYPEPKSANPAAINTPPIPLTKKDKEITGDVPLNARETNERLARDRRYIAAWMAGEGKANMDENLMKMIFMIIVGALLMAIFPLFGWFLGAGIILMSPAVLFDNHGGARNPREADMQIVGAFKNDGYQDRVHLALGVILLLVSLTMIALGVYNFLAATAIISQTTTDEDGKLAFQLVALGVILLLPTWAQFQKYFVPKQDR